MHDINLGAAIARERRAAQVTQGELAAHLGVTKAAVSKWELEQSMPDVALLPRIAAYFDLTLDELFDYRPQLVGDDLQDVYLRLLAQFDEDPEAAFANAEDLVRSHYSCWPALQQMGMLYAQRATLDSDRAEPLAARAAELFERVERHADDVELVRAARMMRASVMSVQGDLDGCIALFESLKPDRTAANIDLMLASMYQQRGDLDAGLKLFLVRDERHKLRLGADPAVRRRRRAPGGAPAGRRRRAFRVRFAEPEPDDGAHVLHERIFRVFAGGRRGSSRELSRALYVFAGGA